MKSGGDFTGSIKLAHYLATAGVASRRACEKAIAAGRITVDGRVVLQLGTRILGSERIECDGEAVRLPEERDHVYIMLNKPVGVVSTMSTGSERGYCLADIVAYPVRIFPVGRLDRETSGLMLLTDDGDLANLIMHPGGGISKGYVVKLNRSLKEREFRILMKGVAVDGKPVEVDNLETASGGRLSISIHEGRKHIVRKLFAALGCKVVELKRIRIGPLNLGKLGLGRWRKLSRNEVHLLKRAVEGGRIRAYG